MVLVHVLVITVIPHSLAVFLQFAKTYLSQYLEFLRSKKSYKFYRIWLPGPFGRTHGAPYRGYGYVPLRFGGNVVRRMGTQQQMPGPLP